MSDGSLSMGRWVPGWQGPSARQEASEGWSETSCAASALPRVSLVTGCAQPRLQGAYGEMRRERGGRPQTPPP